MSDEIVGDTLDVVDAPEAEIVDSPAPSMEDTLRSTLAEIEARDTETEETAEQKAGRTANRLRDEKGRLLPGVKESAPEPAEAVVSAADPIEAAPVAEPVTVPPEVQRLGLRKDEAQAFAAAPDVLKNALIRRSEEMHRGMEPLRQRAQAAEAFERALAPYAEALQQTGKPVHESVASVMAGAYGLYHGTDDQKAVHALNVLKSYNIDLNRVFQIASGQYQPQVSPVQQPVAQPNINELVNAEVEKRFLQQEINQFAATHQHFETLKPLIGSLLDSGAATGLEDGYTQALRAHPTLGQEWVAQQLSAAEEKRKQEAMQRTQAAKQAAAVNISKRGTAPVKRAVGSMDDTIRQEAERLGLI